MSKVEIKVGTTYRSIGGGAERVIWNINHGFLVDANFLIADEEQGRVMQFGLSSLNQDVSKIGEITGEISLEEFIEAARRGYLHEFGEGAKLPTYFEESYRKNFNKESQIVEIFDKLR